MAKINVILAIENLRLGGLEKVVALIAQGLNRDRYQVIVYCLYQGGPFADELKEKGYQVKILGLKSYFNPLNILRLAHQLRRDRVEILHTHGYFASTFSRLAAILARVPIIFTNISSTYYENRPRHYLMEETLALFSDKIICVSEAVREFIMKHERIKPNKLVTIYNGAQIKLPSQPPSRLRARWGIDEKEKVIGTVARLEPLKGIDYLIRAAGKVINSFSEIKFLIVGDGSQRRELEDLVKELHLEEKVVFTGFLTNPGEALAVMDIFILPSTFREGCSGAISEAMAFGLPVIATEVGGNPEMVIDGLNGLLVPPRDSEEIAQAMITLLRDSAKAERMGQEGKKLFEERFSAKVMVKKVEELYESSIEKKLFRREKG